jgi:hypothetical protein
MVLVNPEPRQQRARISGLPHGSLRFTVTALDQMGTEAALEPVGKEPGYEVLLPAESILTIWQP